MAQYKTLDNLKIPVVVKELLSYGPKHPVKEKFNETHFLADIDKLVINMRQKWSKYCEKFCEIESSAKWYAKN